MKFELDEGIEILARTPAVICTLLSGVSESWLLGNEGPDTWSPFDVVGHLIHGEKTDWIPRVRIILAREEPAGFEPFDRFAQEKDSVGKAIDDLLDEFEGLRRSNIAVLKGFELKRRDLDLEGKHPEFGTVTLKQLLATWVVHDLGHLVQVSRAMARQYEAEVGPWRQYLGVLKVPN
jgi:hypothetical protein